MTVLYRILRAINDGLFGRVFQPLLDRTGSTPARFAPALVGAEFAAFLARILLLHRAGHLAEHVFDAELSVAAAATLYRLYLRHAATPGTPNARRSSGTYMGLRLRTGRHAPPAPAGRTPGGAPRRHALPGPGRRPLRRRPLHRSLRPAAVFAPPRPAACPDAHLYQVPYAMTGLAQARVAMERLRSGMAMRAFQAVQQAATMAS